MLQSNKIQPWYYMYTNKIQSEKAGMGWHKREQAWGNVAWLGDQDSGLSGAAWPVAASSLLSLVMVTIVRKKAEFTY